LAKTNKIIIISFLSIPGIIISYILSFFIEGIVIPDECYYESHDSNWLIELLYDFPSWNGYHPYPSTFQFVLIFLTGIGISYVFCKKVLKM
jgi:hypothetical protein